VQVFESDELPEAWSALDEFEGGEYRRVAIDVFSEESDDTPVFRAHIYALATAA
jgi:hypothetical protein